MFANYKDMRLLNKLILTYRYSPKHALVYRLNLNRIYSKKGSQVTVERLNGGINARLPLVADITSIPIKRALVACPPSLKIRLLQLLASIPSCTFSA